MFLPIVTPGLLEAADVLGSESIEAVNMGMLSVSQNDDGAFINDSALSNLKTSNVSSTSSTLY